MEVRSSLLKKKIFRFEAKWTRVDDFDGIMTDFWNQSVEVGYSSWMDRVKHCGKLLMKWDSETFKRTQWRIAWLKKRMKRLQTLPKSRITIDESRELEKELRDLHRLEETAT